MHAFSTNTNRLKAYTVLAILSVLGAMAVNLVAEWLKIPNSWIISAPSLAGVFGLLYVLLDRYAWSWKPLRVAGIISEIPISGTYEGKIIPSRDRKEYPVSVIISQTWTKILVQFDVTGVNTSTSCSISASYEDLCNGDVKLDYTYRNTPNPGIADDDMFMHEGTVELIIKPDGTANGRYFNSRPRIGSIVLKKVKAIKAID